MFVLYEEVASKVALMTLVGLFVSPSTKKGKDLYFIATLMEREIYHYALKTFFKLNYIFSPLILREIEAFYGSLKFQGPNP